jgi:hypothetical protein
MARDSARVTPAGKTTSVDSTESVKAGASWSHSAVAYMKIARRVAATVRITTESVNGSTLAAAAREVTVRYD